MFTRETTKMFLHEIAVAKAYRHQGIRAALIEYLKRICRDNDIDEMFVLADSSNTAAKQLYTSMGGTMDDTAVAFTYSRDAFAK
jgi:ribosomal protein S18 acetylase RimI-like enzyme